VVCMVKAKDGLCVSYVSRVGAVHTYLQYALPASSGSHVQPRLFISAIRDVINALLAIS
jgi:hypothetical protein